MGIIDLAFKAYMLALGLRLFMPHVTNFTDNTLMRGVFNFTEPFLAILRQIVPRGKQGFDWSPLIGIMLVIVVRGLLLSTAAGMPASMGIISSAVEIEDFVVTLLSVVFLGVFLISIGTPFGFSQIGHVMVNMTDPILFPLRRLIGRAPNGADVAAIIAILLLGAVHGLVLYQLNAAFGGNEPAGDITAYLGSGVGSVLISLLNTLYWIMLIRVILTWFAPDPNTPIFQLLIIYTDPILDPIRRVMPSTYGIDFSPLIAILIIGFVSRSVEQFLL